MSRLATAPAREARAARRKTVLGLLVLAVLGLAAWISTVAISGVPWSSPYKVRIALPSGAPLLTGGDEVRIGGERVGQVSSVSLAHGSARRAVATLSLSTGRLHAGASARVRPRGLAGAVYVDLAPGRPGARTLPSGSLIHDVTGGVELTDVVAGFDTTARHALGRSLTAYGDGLAGRGVAVNEGLAGLPALLGNITPVLAAVSPAPGVLSGLIGSATELVGALAPPGDTTLADVISSARTVLSATGGVSQTIDALPATERAAELVLPGADRLLSAASVAARELTPGVAALRTALPGLQQLVSDAPEVSELGAVARVAAPVFSALAPVLGDLRGTAAALTPLSDPVVELAKVLIPYRTEVIQAPLGFTRWGNFTYDFGTGSGHRAVRFSMVLTCALARDPYPAPGAAAKERKPCQ
jgi:phospholipid/cholesterol/gamma-HCH transport system substrate-binding protein